MRVRIYVKKTVMMVATMPINFLPGFFVKDLYSINRRIVKIEYAENSNKSANEGTGAIRCKNTS